MKWTHGMYKKCKQKMAWSHIKPKGQWSDHNYILHTPRMTQVGNTIVLPIISFNVVNPIQTIQKMLNKFEKIIEWSNLKVTL